MRNSYTNVIRLAYLPVLLSLVIGLDSCRNTQDQVTPSYKSGAKLGEVQPSSVPGTMYEDEYIAGDRITLKIVGQDSYSEANDFRLYPTAIACQAYEYLFLRANATGQNELGAYLTNVGVVIGPNALGSSGNYRFRTWGGQLGYRNPVLYTTNYASLPINGMMHTHPGGTSTPSPEDTQELAARFDVPQYIIAGLSIYQFTANGTSTAVASYYDRDCQ